MINHKELLNKFSKSIGIPGYAGRYAMEEFAFIISQNLNFGDKLEIPSLGFFAFKKVKPIEKIGDDFQQIIIFSEEKFSVSDKNLIFFFLPNSFFKKKVRIDSFLNLSFNNPTILTFRKTQKDSTWGISENELEALIKSKTEKLFDEGVIHKSLNESEEEFNLSKFVDTIIFDTIDSTADEQSPISEEPKKIKLFDDFELQQNEFDYSSSEDKRNLRKDSSYDTASRDLADDTTGDEISSSFKLNEIESTDEDDGESFNELKQVRKKRKAITVTSLAGLALLIITGAVYLKFDKIKQLLFQFEHQNNYSLSKQKSNPIIIERNDYIPVISSNEPHSQIIDSLIINIASADMKPTNSTNSLTSEVSNIFDIESNKNKLVKVQGYIYQKNDKFFVQISSWKAKSKAEKEVQKFNDLGYRAELMIYNSSERGRYYKVIVGSFQSIDEAKNFFNQNK